MKYTTVDVPVFNGAEEAGTLRAGIWEPENGEFEKTVLLVHGVTASHRAFDLLVEKFNGVRVIAPDLRGRGRSNAVKGPSSMSAHAADIVQLLDTLGVEKVTVAGHSMGAFVGIVTAHEYPDRVSNLVLVDGGLPLEIPEGLEPDEIIQSVLGPTAERLAMVFKTQEDYKNFWKQHPGLGPYWNDFLEMYFEYDLVETEGGFKAATSYEVARDDTIDLHSGTAIADALTNLNAVTHLVTCPRGLFDQTPGLYSKERVRELMGYFPSITHEEISDVNHYTIVMGERGAQELAAIISSRIS